MKQGALVLAGMGACILISGCLVVGYSSRGGFFLWPGAIVFLLMLLVLWFVLRRH